MCSNYSTEHSEEESAQTAASLEQVQAMVIEEFGIEESFLDHGTPTFHVKFTESKNAFLRLMKRLDTINFIPILREEEGKYVLRVISKPIIKPSRISINLLLFLATIGTTLLAGYFITPIGWVDPLIGASTFTVSLLAILGVHELSHKLAAYKHGIEASAPYFIPGPPLYGIGTFGAVIKQKSPAPNKDALFDLGISGPLIGFIVAVEVAIIGISISFTPATVPPGAGPFPTPLFFDFLTQVLRYNPPILFVHPVAFAGVVGMFVTIINLIPAGMLDGGHTARALLGRKANNIVSIIVIIILLALNPTLYWLIAIIAFFFSMQKHPGPLDDVSKLSMKRKFATILVVVVFILCIAPSPYILELIQSMLKLAIGI